MDNVYHWTILWFLRGIGKREKYALFYMDEDLCRGDKERLVENVEAAGNLREFQKLQWQLEEEKYLDSIFPGVSRNAFTNRVAITGKLFVD